MYPKIEIDGKYHKVFGMYGSKKAAESRILLEETHGMYGKFGVRKIYVGKSVDPAYSDKEGYAYVVYYR